MLELRYDPIKNQKIAYAVSDDLVNWEKKGLCHLPNFEASSYHFGAPFIIKGLTAIENFHMIYQGRASDGYMSFLLLESDDLVHWY